MINFKKNKKIEVKSGELSDFNKWRKKLLKISIVSILLTFTALAIVGLKILYPFHLAIGLTIYALSFIPIIRRVYLSRQTWKKYHSYKFAENFFKKEKRRLFFGVLLIVGSIFFLWLRPLDDDPFKRYSPVALNKLVADDLYKSVTAMDYLETTGNELLLTLENPDEDVNQAALISNKFEEFLKAVAFSESLTDVHRYFGSIPRSLGQAKINSFLISYSLYVKKYEIVHKLIKNVSKNEFEKKVLNQYISLFQRDNNWSEMVVRFYEPKTRLRLSVGYLYMLAFASDEVSQNDSSVLLYEKSYDSYNYLFKHFFETVSYSGEVLVDNTERKMFEVWFPVQKAVANAMGNAILTTRGKEGFITPKQALEMGDLMEPGDIMLQRRNWHLSNVGIPGFWTHAALYTGDLDKMDEFFRSEFPYEGFETFSELVEVKFPKVFEQYKKADKDGYPGAVFEAIAPGVVLQSLPNSANADFVVVLRPRSLSKTDKLLAVTKAFEHFGKPYDYNFDFDTRDSMVCSELVYDAYFERLPEKQGLHFETSAVNGRKMVTPLDMAKKYMAEYGEDTAEFSFVYFLRGNEAQRISFSATEAEFMDSLSWSKFSFLQK